MSETDLTLDGVVTGTDHKRTVTYTEKGHEAKLNQYVQARRAKLAQVTGKVNEINHLKEDDRNLMDIEQLLKEFDKSFLEFCELNESVLLFLREEEQSANQEYWFKPKRDSFSEFVISTNKWAEDAKLRTRIAQECDKEVHPFDSISMVARSQQGSVKSASGARTGSVHTSVSARLREAANKAAIETQVAALKEKQALDLKEVQLKAEKEELLLRTALAV